MDQAGEQRDGSALCLSCGMCCRGMLHGWAALEPEERHLAQDAGLDVLEGEERLAFRLPCPRLDGNACEIYGHRPATCSGYRCRLLDDYLAGAKSLDEARAVVGKAKTMTDEVRALTGDAPFPLLRARWRQGLGAFISGEPGAEERGQRAYLMISALCAYLDRHVVALREPGLLDKSAAPLEKRSIAE